MLQMVGRAGRPQFDTEATAVIMTRLQDKVRSAGMTVVSLMHVSFSLTHLILISSDRTGFKHWSDG